MGYGTRPGGGGHTIRTFTPDDTATEMYIDADWRDVPITEIIEKAQEKWPGCTYAELSIAAEHIHTDCLGYDLYDAGDYTYYLKITRKEGA